MVLDEEAVDGIHEMGGTILSSSRGHQDTKDMVDKGMRLYLED
jgi:6-phosphofructokinase